MRAVTRKRFTRQEYHRMGELGFLAADDRVELIRGEIIQMPRKQPPHSVCNTRLWKELFKLVGDRAIVRAGEPIILSADSEPQPDVVIARDRPDEYLSSHPEPADIFLVVEIADGTLSYDRNRKLSIYAEDGISDYWIFNLQDKQLEAYSEPYRDLQGKFGYASKRIFLPDAVVAIPCFPDRALNLGKIFPGEKQSERF